ncbi:MAG: iron transporter [Planctomycetaceae bacterium]|jgi:Mn2+/Fe2+ NRAMP family transporter|nr:iron transporter [Planctomycetaceae bacterium]MBP60488.1 iron transporter [Planctomycetaceae bacterium]
MIKAPPTTFWQRFRFIGPSLILTATLIGSGELIVTTTYGAQTGFKALWLIVAACFLKVAIQEALGRYTISSGDTSLVALNRLPGPRWRAGWAVWIWLICVILGAVQLGGIALTVGECLQVTGKGFSARMWAPCVCAVCWAILCTGRYQVVEKTSMVLVSLFSISIIGSAISVQWTRFAISWSQILAGFSFQLPRAADFVEGGSALAVIAVVGLSATEIIYYPYWCLEKGYARFTGPNDDSEEWLQRARGWIRVMQFDCYFAMVVYTVTTIAFYLLGAAVLHPQGIVPKGTQVITTLSAMYTDTFGLGAYWIFITCSFLVLFSTLFVSIASYARLLSDCLGLMKFIKISDESSRQKWVQRFLAFTALLFAGASQLSGEDFPPLVMIIAGVIPLAFLFLIVSGTVIYLKYTRLDRRLQPNWPLDVWLWASVLLTLVMTVYALRPFLDYLN